MKIGNIVTEVESDYGVEFNTVTDFTQIDINLPTLIVGHKMVSEIFCGTQLDFTERVVNGIFWTFTKQEYKKYHITDVYDFKEFCYNKIISETDYIFVDPIHLKMGHIKRIINKLQEYNNAVTYMSENGMVYIYVSNLIFGIDTNQLEYIGIKTDKLINRIKSISSVFLGGSDILIEYNEGLSLLNEQKKYVPLLYSISKHG